MFPGLYCVVVSSVLVYVPGCLSQTLLLATSGGVCSLEVETGTLTTILTKNASTVDFRILQEELYFVSYNEMYYSYFSKYEEERPEPIPIFRAQHQLGYMALDWVKYNIFYTVGREVYKGALIGARHADAKIISVQEDLRGIAIDPYERVIFVITVYGVGSYNLDDNSYNRYAHNIHHLEDIPMSAGVEMNRIAVDHYYKEVYLIINGGTQSDWELLRTNYSMRDYELVRGPHLEDTQALDVFRRQVIWVTLNHTLYSCYFPNCTEDNVIEIWQSPEPVHSVRFFSRLAQAPNTSVACQALHCSHSCVELTRYSIGCSCPEGMVIHDYHYCTEPWSSLDLVYTTIHILLATIQSLQHSLSLLPPILVIFLYICCGFMLALLFCGFCLLSCIRKPKKLNKAEEIYSMS